MRNPTIFFALHSLTKRYHWRNMIPTEYCRNSWILALDDEQPITAVGIIDTLNVLSLSGQHSVFIQLHKRTAHNRTFLPDCRSLFDQLERSPPSHVLTNSKSTEPDHHNAVLLEANTIPSPPPECHYVIDSAIPVAKPRFFTGTLKSKHS